MRICIYEDSAVQWLEPITLTRPAFALWCGAERVWERQRRQFNASDIGFWTRANLAEVWKVEQPGHPVNDVNWAREATTVWINGRWMPAADTRIDPTTPHVGLINGEVAYAVLSQPEAPRSDDIDAWLVEWKNRLTHVSTTGDLFEYLWEYVDGNSDALRADAAWFRAKHGNKSIPAQAAILGPADDFIVADDAMVEPFVYADTRGGPVMIDRGAIVHSFSRLEGPCYVGPGSWIVGAKLRAGSTIGPVCRMGGEIEASIVQGFSNKYHDGFLGHSYLGEWVNLAAATQTSDLRNDYDNVRVSVNGQRVATGRSKIGSYIGDHTKTGLGALLNTGSSVGAFASLLPSGSLLPQAIPSFCQAAHGQLSELWDLRKLFQTATKVMSRRGRALTDAHRDFYYGLFESSAARRQKILREAEMRRLRRSV